MASGAQVSWPLRRGSLQALEWPFLGQTEMDNVQQATIVRASTDWIFPKCQASDGNNSWGLLEGWRGREAVGDLLPGPRKNKLKIPKNVLLLLYFWFKQYNLTQRVWIVGTWAWLLDYEDVTCPSANEENSSCSPPPSRFSLENDFGSGLTPRPAGSRGSNKLTIWHG